MQSLRPCGYSTAAPAFAPSAACPARRPLSRRPRRLSRAASSRTETGTEDAILSYPITLGLIIETKDLGEGAGLPEGPPGPRPSGREPVGDCAALLEKLERVRPDVLLIDFTPLGERYEDFFSW